MNDKTKIRQVFQIPVIVAALGYFVDIYDLLLFAVVRIPSLQSLGLKGDELTDTGLYLLNIQMAGLLIGGILWGIMGDKQGRLSVLFGSILIYSVANILNGFVDTVEQYAILRFIAGIGLAGELGAGITLVSEILPKEIRGYGTTLIASVGVLGAVLANFISKEFDWRNAYYIGGGLGLMLLILRVSVFESGIFLKVKESKVSRGNFFELFYKKESFFKYIQCILIGLPIWFVIGFLVAQSPEIGKTLGLPEKVDAGDAIMFAYVGLSGGDLFSGLLSQAIKSRRKVVLIFILFALSLMLLYLVFPNKNMQLFYMLCLGLGFSVGYWALFITIAAEQFGTNIRATVATTVPNFVRGSINVITPVFLLIKSNSDIVQASLYVGIGTVLIALVALSRMKETFGKDLNYIEGEL
jgi:MFS transporter, putative metabolite:H+ symporter